MKKIFSVLLAAMMVFSMSVTAFAADFKDTVDIPQSEAIDVIETLGIVNGYGNDVFGPNDTLTRAQLCTMLTRALYGDPIYTSTNQFKDVAPTHWANAYINTAYAYGLMAGYGGGYFGPEDEITYTQMAAVIMKALGYDCGKMTWPTGINSMGHTLGLFDNVKFDDYANGCTRAHAAQMIYNAFELPFVNHKADYPVSIKGTSFLEDGLGFAVIKDGHKEDGHIYEAYKSLKDKDADPFVTENIITITETIYPVDKDTYKFSNSKNAKTYDFSWKNVELYVNGELVEKDQSKWFVDKYNMTGSFDEDDKLIAIYVENTGDIWVVPTDAGKIEIPTSIYNKVIKDKGFNERTSTVTYFIEDDTYVISNKIVCGFVDNRPTNKSIWIDGSKYTFEDDHGYVKGDFVVIYFDYHNDIAAHVEMDINSVYKYDTDDMILHTWECDHYTEYSNSNIWMNYDEVSHATHLLKDNKTILYFDRCSKCHAKTADRDMITIAPTAETITIPMYVTHADWTYIHTSECEAVTSKIDVEPFEVDLITCEKPHHTCITE